jgi:hypothetical protein
LSHEHLETYILHNNVLQFIRGKEFKTQVLIQSL